MKVGRAAWGAVLLITVATAFGDAGERASTLTGAYPETHGLMGGPALRQA